MCKKRFNYVKNVKEVQLVYADINCDFKFTFCDIDENIFTSMQELEEILDNLIYLANTLKSEIIFWGNTEKNFISSVQWETKWKDMENHDYLSDVLLFTL